MNKTFCKNILLVVLVVLTAFTYKNNYDLTNPSIKIDNLIVTKNILTITLTIISPNNLEFLTIQTYSQSNKPKITTFNLKNKGKKVIVKYFLSMKNLNNTLRIKVTVSDIKKSKTIYKEFNLKKYINKCQDY